MLHPRGTNEPITRVREKDGGEGLEGAAVFTVASLPESRVIAPQKVERLHEFLLGGVCRPQIQVRVQQPYSLVVAPVTFQDLMTMLVIMW